MFLKRSIPSAPNRSNYWWIVLNYRRNYMWIIALVPFETIENPINTEAECNWTSAKVLHGDVLGHPISWLYFDRRLPKAPFWSRLSDTFINAQHGVCVLLQRVIWPIDWIDFRCTIPIPHSALSFYNFGLQKRGLLKSEPGCVLISRFAI